MFGRQEIYLAQLIIIHYLPFQWAIIHYQKAPLPHWKDIPLSYTMEWAVIILKCDWLRVEKIYEHYIWTCYIVCSKPNRHEHFLNKVFRKELRQRRKKNCRKNFGPPSLTLKKFWSPSVAHWKKTGPHLWPPQKILLPPHKTDGPPPPGKKW